MLRLYAPLFTYDLPLEDTPVLPFVAGYVGFGLIVFTCLPALIRATPSHLWHRVLGLVLLFGVAFRVLQFGTEPILEDDFYRYLWDGAVTANGHSPYQYAPEAFFNADTTPKSLEPLTAQAGPILDRVNYPELRTIYPPAAQGGFVLAHWISPLNPDAWRAVLLLAEALVLGLLLMILRQLRQSPLWIALYWWHPVAVKEIANSLHMEPLLMLPVVFVGWLILANRQTLASLMLALAAGVKVWPIILAPVLWRQNLKNPVQLAMTVLLTTLVLSLMIWPIVKFGLDQNSGFVAFAKDWNASSGAYLLAKALPALFAPEHSETAARILLCLIGAVGMVWFCRDKAACNRVLLHRFVVIIAMMYLLLPTQTPWYFLWIAPFLCIFPSRALLLAGALIPLHYLYFHFAPLDLEHFYHYGVVWCIWLPVWALLLYDGLRRPQNPRVDHV